MEYYNDSDEIMIVTATTLVYESMPMTDVKKVVTKTVYPHKSLDVIEVISAVPVIDY